MKPQTRIMPANYEAEQALLGAILMANGVYSRVSGMLQPADFADAVHGRIYEACGKLIGRGQTANVLTLKNLFDQDESLTEVGGARYLVNLAGAVVSLINADDFARVIANCAHRRRVIVRCEEGIEEAERVDLDDTGAEIAARIASDMAQITGIGDDVVSIGNVATQIFNDLDKPIVCYPTGIRRLDQVMGGGLMPSKLLGIVARRKAGKTMLCSTIAYNVAKAGCRVLYIWLEMSKEEITQRIIGRIGGFNSLTFLDPRKRKDVDWCGKVAAATRELADLPLMFEKRPQAPLEAIRQLIVRAVLIHGVKGVVVDYMQLVRGQQKGQSEASHLDNVGIVLAELTRQLDIWMVVAAQENQTGNVRGGEGLLMNCDLSFRLHKVEWAGRADEAWLECDVARYTIRRDAGSEKAPALAVDTKAGPHFAEAAEAGPVTEDIPWTV